METSSTPRFTFAFKIGESNYSFNVFASTEREALKILESDLTGILMEVKTHIIT